MTVKELMDKLSILHEDNIVIFTDIDVGWSNIEVETKGTIVSIVACTDDIFHK